MKNKIIKKFLILAKLDYVTLLKIILNRCFSFNHYYVLNLNLQRFNFHKDSRINVRFDRISDSDIQTIMEKMNLFDSNSKKELIIRLLFYDSGLKNCYVLKNKKNEIVCMQWIVYPSENSILKKHYSRRFYELREKQVMIENIFTFPKYRGFGFMQKITLQLLNLGKNQGYKNAIAYIRKDNINSINGFIKLGFKITKIITEYKFLGYLKRKL